MKAIDLDNNPIIFPPTGYIVPLDDLRPRSELHIKCRELLRELFPTLIVLEEVPVNVRWGKTLYLDFYLPQKKLIIECDGGQHDEYTPFFHKTVANFRKSQSNDRMKEEWAKLNNIRLVRIKAADNIEELVKQ